MKKILVTLMVFAFSAPVFAKYEAHFSPQEKLITFFEQKMKDADDTIDIAIYNFSNSGVKKVLLDKLKDKVKVRIIMWKGADKEDFEKRKEFLKELVKAGADVRTVSKVYHHKFAIIDNEVLLNSSGNLSRDKDYDENLIICDDCDDRIAVYSREINNTFPLAHYFTKSQKGRPLSKTAKSRAVHTNYAGLALFTSANFWPSSRDKNGVTRFVIKPTKNKGYGHVEAVLAKAIDNASNGSEIKMASAHFRSRSLFDAVIRAHKRGVQFEIVLDGQEYISASGEASKLSKRTEKIIKKALEPRIEKQEKLGLSKMTAKQKKAYDAKWAKLSRGEKTKLKKAKYEAYKKTLSKAELKKLYAEKKIVARAELLTEGAKFSRQLHLAKVPLKFKIFSVIWAYKFSKQMHSKYMLIDDPKKGSTLYTGSYNWSDSGEFSTFENMGIYNSKDHPDIINILLLNTPLRIFCATLPFVRQPLELFHF